MSRNNSVFTAVGVAILTLSFGTCLALADPPPAGLPLLPPPDKAPVPPAGLPVLPPPNQAPAPPVFVTPTTLVPVEFRISVADLEKQMLRSLIQKLDPKAEPVLPIVVKGNEPNFALGKPLEAGKQMPEGARDPRAVEMPPERPQLIPRPPGARPRLDRLAARPLVADVVGLVLGKVDLAYRIELRSYKIAISGNTLTCELGGAFHCEGKPSQQGPGPMQAPPNVRDLNIKMTVTKNLEWSESGKLELKEGSSKVWIDPEAPLIGFPRLDVERVVRLNGMIALMGGMLDRELMKRLSTENLPDLAVIAPTLKQKMPFLAVSELTAYPIRGDEKNVYFSLMVGLVALNKMTNQAVKIATKPGPAPEPKVRGQIVFDKDGKPDVKLDPVP